MRSYPCESYYQYDKGERSAEPAGTTEEIDHPRDSSNNTSKFNFQTQLPMSLTLFAVLSLIGVLVIILIFIIKKTNGKVTFYP